LIINQLIDYAMSPARRHFVATPDAKVGGDTLDAVFAALADPVRRSILMQLDGHELLVSELAGKFDISLQAVSKHIQVLVRTGLVAQERTGRISRCSLVAGPIYDAAVWINRYSKYWQQQFDLLAVALEDLEHQRSAKGPSPAKRQAGPRRRRKPSS
jgi:DNA-binding transcriptional ArsR family regulator